MRHSPLVFLCVFAASLATLEVRADRVRPPEVFVTGLDNPRGLGFAPDGRLFVAEAGLGGSNSTAGICPQAPPPVGPFTGAATARISAITPLGTRFTVAQGLPSTQTSAQTGGEVEGAEEVVFLNGFTYVLTQGGGCSKGNPDQPNGIYRIEADGSHTLIADLSAWFFANPTQGPQDSDRDPEGVPTSMVLVNDKFYVLEGNQAQLVEVTLDGAIRRIADLSFIGQLTYTALEYGRDGHFYVGTFGEIPYPNGGASLFRVSLEGEVTQIRTGLTNVIDIRFDCAGHLHILEASSNNTPQRPFLVPGSGRVLRLTGNRLHLVTEGLTFPTGMTFGPRGRLYISNFGFGFGPEGGLGEVVSVDVGGPQGCY